MREDIIDSNIQVIADGLSRNIPESEIIEAYIKVGFEMSDVTLLLAAGKLLYNDRKSAPPVKGMFRRVQ